MSSLIDIMLVDSAILLFEKPHFSWFRHNMSFVDVIMSFEDFFIEKTYVCVSIYLFIYFLI